MKVDFTGKGVAFTSTNGTMVLQKISHGSDVYTASFINHAATVRRLSGYRQVDIFVSGRPDGKAAEDEIYAEFLAEELRGKEPNPSDYLERARNCGGATRLKLMGFSADIETSLQFNLVDFAVKFENDTLIKDM